MMSGEYLQTGEDAKTIAGEGVRSIHFEAMFRMLYLRRRLIQLTTLIFALLAMVLALVIKPNYTAVATFVPPSSTGSSSASALAGQLSSALGLGASMGGKSPGDLYVGLLKSQTIAIMVVEKFGLREVYREKKESLAEKQLASNSTFEVGVKDTIVRISVTDKSPVRARDMANDYLDALKRTAASLALTESSQRRLFYENRLAQEKEALANSEVALKQTQEQTGLIAPAGQTASEIQALAQLRAQIAGREVQLASLRHDETEQNPDVIRLRNEMANLQSQVASMENGKDGGPHGAISAAQVPAMALDYIRKAREVKYHEALFEIIAKQYEAARLDEANSAPLQILDKATLPDSRSGPSRLLILVGGAIGGFLLSCCWVLLQNNAALQHLLAMVREPSGPR